MDAMPSVFILNLSYTGLGIARSLAGSGIKVYGIGSIRRRYGNFSRFVHFIHSPDSLTQKAELYKFLIDLALKEPVKPVIFPTRDHDIVFLRDYKEPLEPYFVYSQPANDILEQVLNKWELHNVSVKCHVPTPKTFLIESAKELEKSGDSIEYPALLKPLYAADWRKEPIWEAVGRTKAILVNSNKDLSGAYSRFCHLLPTVLLQEYVEGKDDDIYTFCSYCNNRSEILAFFNTRKIRQSPERLGTGIVVRSTVNPELTEVSTRILKCVGFSGVSEIEYKRDPNTGKYYLIEINPRFWDQHELSKSFGLNLPLIVYNDLVGRAGPNPTLQFHERTWIAEDGFIVCMLHKLMKDRKELFKLISEVSCSRKYAIWDLRDPLPFLVSMLSMMFHLLKQLILRIPWV